MMKKQLKKNYRRKNYLDLLYDDVGKLITPSLILFSVEIIFQKAVNALLALQRMGMTLSIKTTRLDFISITNTYSLFLFFFESRVFHTLLIVLHMILIVLLIRFFLFLFSHHYYLWFDSICSNIMEYENLQPIEHG